MSDDLSQNQQSYVDELGNLNVPEALAVIADQRAYEIFSKEVHFETPFKKILGQIYMVGVTAGIDAAQRAKPDDPHLIAAATNAVRDEAGSRLCNWTDIGTERQCWADSGRFCLCRNVAIAVMETISK